MPKKKTTKRSSRTLRIPLLGITMGLALAEKATSGAMSHAVRGEWSGAKSRLNDALLNPGRTVKESIGPAVGLAVYSVAKKHFKPGVKIGPVRIEA